DWTVRFATMLIASQMNVYWQFPSGTRSEAIDSEVCDLLQRSGCKNLVYAPESGSPTTLKMIKKQVHLERMKESIQSAIRVGINVRVNFVIGFPGEGHKQILESFKFLLSLAWLGAHDITHFIFAPYPGSELFQKLREVGRIPELTDDYFIGLLCYTDMKRTISYDDKIQSWQLAAYRVTALLFFYFFMFLFRPWRILRILANVFKEKQESRMEMALKNILIRRRTAGSMLAR
ncbi:MAG: radical SAM protein, partial [Elusimicrobia bacterium]|nr:radical SAM protein [Elusimicrobiota bacterium]